MKSTALCFLLTLVGFALFGQTASGPVLGWALSADGRNVQMLSGVPGASRSGAPVNVPADLQILALSPAANLALALSGDAGLPAMVKLDTWERTLLDQARPGPDAAVWSPSGTAVALVYRPAQWVQTFSRKGGGFQLRSEWSALARQVAVSDDGSALLALSDDGLSLYSGADVSILSRSVPAAFTFLAGGTAPAFWSDGQLSIGSQSVALQKDDGEQLFLFSPGARQLLVVRSSNGRVSRFDDSGQVLDERFCNCPVSGLEPAGRASTVRLVTAVNGPLWLAEGGSGTRLFFVPVQQ